MYIHKALAAECGDFVTRHGRSNRPAAVSRDQLGEHFAASGIAPALTDSCRVKTV